MLIIIIVVVVVVVVIIVQKAAFAVALDRYSRINNIIRKTRTINY